MFVIILVCILYVFSTICRTRENRMGLFFGWNYAHRGLYGNGVPENSLESFRRARERGYGVELDVHLLADGNLAVIHDSLLQRVTGQDGRIEELRIDQLEDYFLGNSMQTIPSFEQVLHLFDGRVPLIIELKSYGKNYGALCKKTCELLDAYNGLYCLESFDPRCVYWLRKNRPDIIRGQITQNYFKSTTSTLPWVLKFILTNLMTNFLTQPDFVAYKFKDRKNLSDYLVRKLWKCPSVTWTVADQGELDIAIKEARVPIFENFEP